MLWLGKNADNRNVLDALSASQAVIEFDLKGNILTANKNFCVALGYELAEIIGKHHRIFCDQDYINSKAYSDFWAGLGAGKFDARDYKRIRKDGSEIWIEASYNPVLRGGQPYKVVKIATDITAKKLKAEEDNNKLQAISRSQAVIEFTPTGEIITANDNFCATLGYSLSDIVGKHHRVFCEPTYSASADYASFWKRLAAGEFISDEFVRFGKNGKEVWIQAAYNPILNSKGLVVKVVKFATDVTPRMSAISTLGSALRLLADGELRQSLDVPFVPSMEKLRADFNEVMKTLRSTMQTVAHNSATIASGSAEIRVAADQLARRTEQQAASLEESAAALEEITTTVKDSSSRADEAGRLVASTRQSAERSGEIVHRAIEAMDEISQSSGEITSIISVIDEIAFQTNLLALNAGVEAARAGEAGKGFAVVAQEVRELAQRSASAAKAIKELINKSRQHVSNGVELVGQTGDALKQIAEQVGQIDLNVVAIVEASREQANGLAEINDAVNLMDQATQKNAAMVEETTAASHGLAREAESLRELLTQFQVSDGPASSAPSSRYGTDYDEPAVQKTASGRR
ncbi:putative methyl-accepting chemotaxis protein [Agrobacterium rubi TR3 = NBRC 13261]|uniref:Putative methyl-accepting chemotaxis protein n=1 Tax=Agrobacterium rubi TR3 = NBRC 13261 TaxID=1368415 RepID=A0A081CX95_9HYPH|nr:PAS domain-containing methyl-accepting chemotaxis protein [Agrobacterium rubi]MBP1879774.1 methyl-accepting chemotaxis protein [Agrobacterium rubi]GAK71291.1 putative methyl-accepting chemotaxis protein [Agrobacterium rubi TR3 = NBRC 13261]